MKIRKINVLTAAIVSAIAVSATVPVFADELTSIPAVCSTSSTATTIINGKEYTREEAYNTIRSYFDYNFNPDNYSDLEDIMYVVQLDLDMLYEGYHIWAYGDWRENGLANMEYDELCIDLIQFLMDTL